MPYFTQAGIQMGEQVILAASAARTANGNGPAVDTGSNHTARLLLDVTAASGTTPSMTVTIETSADGSTNWTAVGAFAAVTAAGQSRKAVGGLDRYIRASWAITGTTPSFTFSVSGGIL